MHGHMLTSPNKKINTIQMKKTKLIGLINNVDSNNSENLKFKYHL